MMSRQSLKRPNQVKMNTTPQTKRWLALVLGASAALAVTGPWLGDASPQVIPKTVTLQQYQDGNAPLPAGSRFGKPAEEFFAARKEKHIQRLLANLIATLNESDQLKRSEHFLRRMEALADEDVPGILQRLDEHLRRSEFGILLVRRWAQADPGAAAQWVEQLTDGEERNGLLVQVATLWSNHDLAASAEWAKSLSDENSRQTALFAVTEEAIRQTPASALQLAGGLSAAPARQQLTIRALNEWAVQEPVAALQWVAAVTDPVWQQQLRASLVPVIATLDGRSGARLAAIWLPQGQNRSELP
jgi:hypothetical protein